jgi:DNA-binding NarL/FixJ family response regulator
LLVDDHPMMRAGLAQLIDKQSDLEVSGEAGDAAAALTALEKTPPDLLITDITLPGRSGIELIKDARALHPQMPILVLTLHDESLYAERALRAGARGYLMKDSGAANLLEAIRQLLAGQVYVSQRLAARMLDIFSGHRSPGATSPIQKLTDREFEVFRLIGLGKTAKQIGLELHLSSKTVDVHRANIKKKLGIYDVSSLVSYAARWLESDGTELLEGTPGPSR